MQGMSQEHRSSLRRIGVSLLITILLAVALVPLMASASAPDPSIVTTKQGAVKGNVGSTSRSFLGIPYAAAPVGNLRWKPPQAHASWSSTLDATKPGSPCPQVATPFGQASVNENCLFLNVYTPNPVRAGMPVMIWIHGGAFVAGEGSDFDPSSTLVAQGTIVVTINYRLGIFGFLGLPALTAESADDSSGNYGLQDQQFAFQWVHDNIAAFGGNPSNVTIFGESAGGISVCAHIASPTAHGLFDQAITESGPCTFPLPTLATAETTGESFAAALGCTQSSNAAVTACLRALSVQQLLAQEPTGFNLSGGTGSILPFSPNVSGKILPLSLTDALTLGEFNHVPVIEGTNQTEGRLFVAIAFDLVAAGPLTAAEYPTAVANIVGSQFATQVLNEYPLSDFSSPDVALAAIIGDAGFSCTSRAADQLLAASVPTFAYEFNDVNAPMIFLPPASFPYGATHTDEIQYLFQIDGQASLLNANQTKLSNQMVSYWAQFAKNGNPNSASTVNWAAYSSVTDNFHSLVAPTPTLELNFSAKHNCGFWTGIALQMLL